MDELPQVREKVPTSSGLAALRQLAAGAALREDPEVLVRRLFLAVAEPMRLDFFVHYRYPGTGTRLDLGSAVGVAEDDLPRLSSMVLGEAVCGRVAQTRMASAHADVDRSEDEHLAVAASLGARSYASFPLLDGAELLGTLSFGSRSRSSMTEAELEVLRLATDVLAAAVAHHRDHTALDQAREAVDRYRERVDQLTAALESRDHVSRVKGMLMLTLGLTDEQAWQLLVRLSQTTNQKLRDVVAVLADHLLHGAPLPPALARQLPQGLRAPAARSTR